MIDLGHFIETVILNDFPVQCPASTATDEIRHTGLHATLIIMLMSGNHQLDAILLEQGNISRPHEITP